MPNIKSWDTNIKERATLYDILLWIFHDQVPLNYADAKNQSLSQQDTTHVIQISSDIPEKRFYATQDQLLSVFKEGVITATAEYYRHYDDEGNPIKRTIDLNRGAPGWWEPGPVKNIPCEDWPPVAEMIDWKNSSFKARDYDPEEEKYIEQSTVTYHNTTIATIDLFTRFPHKNLKKFKKLMSYHQNGNAILQAMKDRKRAQGKNLGGALVTRDLTKLTEHFFREIEQRKEPFVSQTELLKEMREYVESQPEITASKSTVYRWFQDMKKILTKNKKIYNSLKNIDI